MQKNIKLYSYWRSSCSYRVRIVLNLKGIEYDYIPVHLVKEEQKSEEYVEINPNATVPSLMTKDGDIVTQSGAIIEFVEEMYPNVALLPKDPIERAQVRAICDLIGCDIQPVQNLRVLNYVGEKKAEWCKHFISLGFQGLEKMLQRTSKLYCYQDNITMADAYLVPQVYNAIRWGVDLADFPTIERIFKLLIEMEAFKKAAPDAQPDAQ
jgi:maleylacetoacetate isomerase